MAKSLSPLLHFVRNELSELPANVRFVITSRPEPQIVKSLEYKFEPFTIETNDPQHEADLRALLTDKVTLRIQCSF